MHTCTRCGTTRSSFESLFAHAASCRGVPEKPLDQVKQLLITKKKLWTDKPTNLELLADKDHTWLSAVKRTDREIADKAMHLVREIEDLRKREKLLIETLQWYGGNEPYKIQNPDEYDAGDFAKYNIFDDCGKLARLAIQSLAE